MKRKSNILTVMKKELRRFFGDRRMLATLILPGLLIYVIYSLMGGALADTVGGSGEDVEYRGGEYHLLPLSRLRRGA